MSTRMIGGRGLGMSVAILAMAVSLGAQDIESPVEMIEGLEPLELEFGDHTAGAEINPTGDLDRYEFFAEVDDVVDLILTVPDSQEMWIEVRDPRGTKLVTNWTASGGGDFRTRVTIATRGMHSAHVKELHGDEVGRYVLHLERLAPPAVHPTLQRLYYGAAATNDTIAPASDTDVFIFEGVEGSSVEVFLEALDPFRANIEIWSADGVRLRENWTSTRGADFRTELLVPATGIYTVAVSARTLGEVGDYRLTLQCTDGDCPAITPAVYEIVDAGPNCVSIRLTNNVAARGGELGLGYDSSVITIEPGDVTRGPGMPVEIDAVELDVVTDIPLAGCPADSAIDRGLTINWVNLDLTGEENDFVLQPGRREIITLCFDPASGVDNATCPELKFLSCLGDAGAPVENLVTHNLAGTVEAETVDSRLCLTVGTPFRRGDANGDGRYDVSDAIAILICEFVGQGCTSCRAASDANDDGDIDQSDAIYLLTWRFHEGPRPPAPFPGCGEDPTSPSPELCIEPACF